MKNRSQPETIIRQRDRPRVAIVGAGISGLICAGMLKARTDVQVFEKSSRAGGRMSTRKTEIGLYFDHGAQYFTARDQLFQSYLDSWTQSGVASLWPGRICSLTNGSMQWKEETTKRYVGVPGMNAICGEIANGVQIEFKTRVAPPSYQHGRWLLNDVDRRPLGQFDYFLTSAPARQSAELLASAPNLQRQASSVKMNGCWAAMIAFDEPLDLQFDAAFVQNSALSWIARDDSKPERATQEERLPAAECWVLHASPEWSEQHSDGDPNSVQTNLLDAFWQATAVRERTPSSVTIHHWRFAIPPQPLDQRNLFDAERKVGACGDWCGGPRVEGALLSGVEMAKCVARHIESR